MAEADDLDRRERDLLLKEIELLRLEKELIIVKSNNITLREVEETLPTFDGRNIPVGKFLQNLEENGTLYGCSESQMLIHGKKLLRGTAKLWLQSLPLIPTWKMFKAEITEEFGARVSAADLHQQLMKRVKLSTESYQDYVLHMVALANQGNIAVEDTIQYVIDGIVDSEVNKTILYGAKTIAQLKEKLHIYEKMKSRNNVRHHSGNDRPKAPAPSNNSSASRQRTAPEDTAPSKGPRCYNCQRYGHVSVKCPNKKDRPSNSSAGVFNVNSSEVRVRSCTKQVIVSGYQTIALIDTGSTVSLITMSELFKLKNFQISEGSIVLYGLGANRVQTLGVTVCEVCMDGHKYSVKLYVVPDGAISHSVLLGREILDHADVVFRADDVEVTPRITEKDNSDPCKDSNSLYKDNNTSCKDNNLCTGSDKCESDSDFNFCFDVCEDKNVVDITHLKRAHQKRVQELIQNYNPANQTRFSELRTKIVLKCDDQPIHAQPRRLSHAEKVEVDRQLEKWIEEGIAVPSNSEYASPIVLVGKKDGTKRICVDYRKLNQNLVKDRYPLPLIEDQLDRLRDAQVFTTLDLKNGFFHVPLHPDSTKYTSFVTPSGQYEFLRTPFGLCNSPASFQRFINEVFKKQLKEGTVLIYIDDVFILAENEEQGLERLADVLKTAEEYGLQINWKKCHFLEEQIDYLGHHISRNRISPSSDKVKAVKQFPIPTSVKRVQSFLGLAGYFRKFIPGFSRIAKPLSDLTKSGVVFKFGSEERIAFETLKSLLSDKPVLAIYSPDAVTELHCDASIDGYGAVLLQQDPEDGKLHPIYYMSKKTTPAERKYSSYELEVLAIINALKKFRVYLLGISFTIVTDCAAFTMTMKKKELATRVARWALLLEEFNYKIVHRSGNMMPHVDSLSRNPVMLVSTNTIVESIKVTQDRDEHLKAIKKILEKDDYEDYVLENNVLYKQLNGEKLLVIPTRMQQDLIRRCHEENGHFSVKKTCEVISKDYWFTKMNDKIKDVIDNCVHCILWNRKSGKQEGLLHPIEKGDLPFSTYHIDHLGPMVATNKGYRYLLVIVDAFTKFTWIYPTKGLTSQEVIQKMEVQKVNFGNPMRLIADRGTAFRSEEFSEYCKEQYIRLQHITTGVPRGNGQVERIHKIIVPVLAKLSADKPESWYKNVGKVQMSINSSFQRSIGLTPFELLFGIRMNKQEDLHLKRLIEEELIEDFQTGRNELRERAKLEINKIQEENRRNFNKKRKPATLYKEGDIVAIKRTQFTQASKLRPKFLGPYIVTKAKGNERYDVKRLGPGEPPAETSSSADNMKPWASGSDSYVSGTATSDESDSEPFLGFAPEDIGALSYPGRGELWDLNLPPGPPPLESYPGLEGSSAPTVSSK